VLGTCTQISETMVIGGVLLKDLLWRAAASYTRMEFYEVMKDIKRASKDAYAYLEKIDPNTWCRGWFNTHCKSGLLHQHLRGFQFMDQKIL
jgi:homospermidine synthase